MLPPPVLVVATALPRWNKPELSFKKHQAIRLNRSHIWIVNSGQSVARSGLQLTQLAVCLEPESELKYMNASSLYLMSSCLPLPAVVSTACVLKTHSAVWTRLLPGFTVKKAFRPDC